jgi:hypothetical protein
VKQDEIEKAYELMENGKSLSRIGEALGYNKRTIYDNLKKDTHRYTRARELQAEGIVDRFLDITEELDAGVDKELVQSKRAASDNYKWLACKFYPKMYGDKQQIEHSGGFTMYEKGLEERQDEIIKRAAERRSKAGSKGKSS